MMVIMPKNGPSSIIFVIYCAKVVCLCSIKNSVILGKVDCCISKYSYNYSISGKSCKCVQSKKMQVGISPTCKLLTNYLRVKHLQLSHYLLLSFSNAIDVILSSLRENSNKAGILVYLVTYLQVALSTESLVNLVSSTIQ